MQKDVRQFLKSLKKQGWTLVRRSNHTEAHAPTGGKVTVPHTPSDHRSLANTKAEARRLGWHDPSKPQKGKGR